MDVIFMAMVAIIVGLGVCAIATLIALGIDAVDEYRQDRKLGLTK